MQQATCDFCGDGRPIWRYPARDALVPPSLPGVRDARSSGDWAACARCGELIEQERVGDLAREAAWRLQLNGIPLATRPLVRMMHNVFWRARIVQQDRRPYVALPGESDRPL